VPSSLTRRAFGGSLAATAALARTLPAFGAEPDAVSVGIANAISDAVIFVGIAKRYFHDEGLTVTTATFASASDMVAPLGAGQLTGDISAERVVDNSFVAAARQQLGPYRRR
jgi:ABC-type nitrate/sulfonate/bicarbonate transport system substrate-binding protein